MSTPTSLIAVVLLLAANAFFVAAEFALVKARGFRIAALAKKGSASAALTMRIQANLEAYLAACQLGITMASLGLGWVGEPAVAHLLEPLFAKLGASASVVHTTSFVVGFLLFSSLHIVIGEQVPKTFAIRQPEPVSLRVAYPLHLSYLAVLPLNWLLNKATSSLLSLFGVQAASHAEVLTGDELKGLVATSREHGEFEEEHADMLHNLFEFDRRQVGRVMIPRNAVHCLDLSAPAEANLEIIRETEHSRFPVIDGDQGDAIMGILLVKDIHRALLNGETEPWLDLRRFCRDPLVVPESQKVPQLFELMRQSRAHMAFVIDEYGTFVGAVTLEDLLEEIVGEIEDETDEQDALTGIEPIGEGQWEADGLVSLGDLDRMIGLTVPATLDANTLSGLFMERLARMPEVGDSLVERGFLLTVLSIQEHRVGRATITRVVEPSDPLAPANPPPAS
ncbi:MAG TPA: hemolysin family protein, partial [Planctomycetota bacterium]|nr:hemolysin family protein [Planctomycetota bacterium]